MNNYSTNEYVDCQACLQHTSLNNVKINGLAPDRGFTELYTGSTVMNQFGLNMDVKIISTRANRVSIISVSQPYNSIT